MTKIQITKVIQTRGDDWALVKFRNAETEGTCAGYFGCTNVYIVTGQIYLGNLQKKRSHDGTLLTRFKGKPAQRMIHRLQYALKSEGVTWSTRDAMTSAFKTVKKLFDVIEHKRWTQLTSLPGIGKATLKNIEKAYESIKPILQRSNTLQSQFPTLAKYMNNDQIEAAMKWMKKPETDAMTTFLEFLHLDPFRIIYHCEFDSFTYVNTARDEFLKTTKHTSRVKMAEAAATDLGISANDSRRGRYNVIEVIKRHMTKTGDYWMSRGSFFARFAHIEPTWPIVQHEGHVALMKYADIEQFIQKEFAAIVGREQPPFQLPEENVQLDKRQREAVQMACVNPLFVLQGGAGVGKTSVCQHIVKALYSEVTCAAPTGKAAQRLKESTGVEAFTVHRLYYSKSIETCPTLLLDEQSMQDLEILAKVLHERTFNKIIFVGDTAQLTSIGPGQFLKDLCASDIPRIELTHIYRTGPDSFIATNGQKIRRGDTNLETAPSSFEVFPYQNEEQIVKKAITVSEETGTRPMVLCNTNNEIAILNRLLRQHFNPPTATVTSKPMNLEYISSTAMFRYQNWRFALNDSVINVTNKYKEEADGIATKIVLQVANGDIGIIVKITPDSIWVRYSDDCVKYRGPIDYSEYLRPAYALTVNKAQGSEYDFVIVKSVSSFGDKKERFYTAVTRAKKKCIIYEVGTANNDCIRAASASRKTFLFKR
jgi:hypothetical protein